MEPQPERRESRTLFSTASRSSAHFTGFGYMAVIPHSIHRSSAFMALALTPKIGVRWYTGKRRIAVEKNGVRVEVETEAHNPGKAADSRRALQ